MNRKLVKIRKSNLALKIDIIQKNNNKMQFEIDYYNINIFLSLKSFIFKNNDFYIEFRLLPKKLLQIVLHDTIDRYSNKNTIVNIDYMLFKNFINSEIMNISMLDIVVKKQLKLKINKYSLKILSKNILHLKLFMKFFNNYSKLNSGILFLTDTDIFTIKCNLISKNSKHDIQLKLKDNRYVNYLEMIFQ